MMIKIASWNVNSLKVRLEQVLEWLSYHQADVLALQETKLRDEHFPAQAFTDVGYQVCFVGQATYNGMALISRQPLEDVVTNFPEDTDPQRRLLAATVGDVRIINIYVPNGQAIDSEKYQYKLAWLTRLNDYVTQQLQQYQHLIVLGDLNIAPSAEDVHDAEAWEGQVLCSEPERAAFQRLLACGLVDSFRLFEQASGVFSWWDYRQAAFRRNLGLRIDHILVSQALAKRCQSCIIDKEVRAWERPSDHAVVMAEFF